jgi:hypothetical protein
MARWILFLGNSMAEAIELLLRADIAGFTLHDLFLHDLTDPRIEQAPAELAHLLSRMLSATSAPFYNVEDLQRAYSKLKTCSISEDILHEIAEAAMYLEISLE